MKTFLVLVILGLLALNEFEAVVVSHQREVILQLMQGSDCPLQRVQ